MRATERLSPRDRQRLRAVISGRSRGVKSAPAMYRTAEALYQGYYDRHGVLVRDRRSWMVSRFVEQLLRGEPVTRAQWDRYGAAGGRPEFLFETVNKLAASHRAPPPVWWPKRHHSTRSG